MQSSALRCAILTTDTLHHRYFIQRFCRESADFASLVHILFETRGYPWVRRARGHVAKSGLNLWRGLALNPYLQPRQLQKSVEAFEKERFFSTGDISLPAGVPVWQGHSVNDAAAIETLRQAAPDLILVYGTGLVKPQVYSQARIAALNAHGGQLPGYRGLDTNLWAIFEGYPERMAVTWHAMATELDAGQVYCEAPIPPHPELALHSLRGLTAEICTDLALDLVRKFASATPQGRAHDLAASRYFGPMPWLYKRKADRLLRAYAAQASAQ